MTRNRLDRLEKAVSGLGAFRCPRCCAAGRDTLAVLPRVFVDYEDDSVPPSEAERTCQGCGTVAGLVTLRGIPKMFEECEDEQQ